MKITTVTLMLLISTGAVAQNYPSMTEEVMQKIQKMQSCINNVDKGKLQLIEQRQNQFDIKVKSLCGNGKRDEAQKKALLYGKEMIKNPTIQAMSKCGEIAKGMMLGMPSMHHDEGDSNQHVCDSI